MVDHRQQSLGDPGQQSVVEPELVYSRPWAAVCGRTRATVYSRPGAAVCGSSWQQFVLDHSQQYVVEPAHETVEGRRQQSVVDPG